MKCHWISWAASGSISHTDGLSTACTRRPAAKTAIGPAKGPRFERLILAYSVLVILSLAYRQWIELFWPATIAALNSRGALCGPTRTNAFNNQLWAATNEARTADNEPHEDLLYN